MPGETYRKTLRTACGVVAAAAAFALPAAVLAQSAEKGGTPSEMRGPAKGKAPSASPSREMHRSMMEGMKEAQKMRMSGDMDRDFAMMMRKHHEDGVKMSQYQLEHGKDAKMLEMAKKIMVTQKEEIAQFDAWLKAHPEGKKQQK